MDQKTIVKIKVNSTCFDMYPCQHRVKIYYSSGIVEDTVQDSDFINKYIDKVVPMYTRDHFKFDYSNRKKN